MLDIITVELLIVEYVAGKVSGKSVGFQAKGDSIPLISKAQETPFPIIRTFSAEQRAFDYEYNSVDEDEDGMPDKAPGVRGISTESKYGGETIRVTPVIKLETYATAPVIRAVETVPTLKETYGSSPVVVRVVETEPEYPATVVRLTTDTAVKQSVKDYAASVKEVVIEEKPNAYENENVRSRESYSANQRRTSTVVNGRLDEFLRNLAPLKTTHQTTYYNPVAVVSDSTPEAQGGDSIAVDAFGFRRIIWTISENLYKINLFILFRESWCFGK